MPLLVQGTPIVVSNDYLPQSLVELANAHRCTVAPLIPMVFEHLASMPSRGEYRSIVTSGGLRRVIERPLAADVQPAIALDAERKRRVSGVGNVGMFDFFFRHRISPCLLK